MKRWHSRNPNIFRLVVEANPFTGASKIVASFKAVPLKNVTIAFLELEALTGTNLPVEHIVKPKGKPSAWYIGDLVSTDRASAIAIMREMVEYLSANLQPDTPIYARGLTEKGLALLRDFQFEPVGDHKMELGRICRLLGNDVQELVNRLHSTAPLRLRPQGKAGRSGAQMPRSTGTTLAVDNGRTVSRQESKGMSDNSKSKFKAS